MTSLQERERDRVREREISLIVRPFPVVNAVIFQRERERDAKRLRKQQQFQRRNIAGNY